MLTLFKKLFGKAEPKAPAPSPAAPLIPSAPMPTIEVAHLSLAAITATFPEELKPLLAGEPAPNATVALPMPTILKQLAAGCVKMSLATLQRQAHGLIRPLPPGDKRMVDVPLKEVFRHVRPSSLKRRPDQRPVSIPDTGFNLFADASNPYAISPDDHLEQIQVVDLTPEIAEVEQASEPVASAPRILKMDDGLRQHFANTPATRSGAVADSPSSVRFELPEPPDANPIPTEAPDRNVASAPIAIPARTPAPAPVTPTVHIGPPIGATLDLKLAPLAASWPEEIRRELASFDPATIVTFPVEEIGRGLSKGRVSFSWGQIRAWSKPPASAPTAADESSALGLPLKMVAPAFLAATKKPKMDRKNFEMDDSIPALFSDGRAPAPAPEAEAPAAPAPHVESHPAAPILPDAAAATPSAVDQESASLPESVGELFGVPQKKEWTPAEIVTGVVKLPGVAGAIVALQEGLQVASSLPEGVKSEVVAAFLPQIFARLNQYSGEMKLGDVDDLLFTTHGAHCQIYRLGYVYLAVLGKPGESLPWHALRLVSEELARQTHK